VSAGSRRGRMHVWSRLGVTLVGRLRVPDARLHSVIIVHHLATGFLWRQRSGSRRMVPWNRFGREGTSAAASSPHVGPSHSQSGPGARPLAASRFSTGDAACCIVGERGRHDGHSRQLRRPNPRSDHGQAERTAPCDTRGRSAMSPPLSLCVATQAGALGPSSPGPSYRHRHQFTPEDSLDALVQLAGQRLGRLTKVRIAHGRGDADAGE